MKSRIQNKNILRIALSLSVLLHLAGFYLLFPLQLSSQENDKPLKVKVIYEQAKKTPTKITPAAKPISSQKIKKIDSNQSAKAKLRKAISPIRPNPAYSPVPQKSHAGSPQQNPPSTHARKPQHMASFKPMSPSQKIMQPVVVAEANTTISAKSPVKIEAQPQSAIALQIASIHPQALSRRIQSSTPTSIEGYEALKMTVATSKTGLVKERAYAQIKTPPTNSIGEVFKTAQTVHPADKAVSARKEIRQRSHDNISSSNYHPAPIKKAPSSAPVATNSLRHPAKQFPFLSTGKESSVSPQKLIDDMPLNLARLFPAKLRPQFEINADEHGEEIGSGSASIASLYQFKEPRSNPIPGSAIEADAPLGQGANPADFSGNDSEEIHRGFSSQIWGKIAEQKYYPRVARKRGYQGKPVVSFTIGEAGNLMDLVLLEASSHKILDDAALLAVKNASPYPRIPEALKLQSMQFKLPITFILDGP